MTYEDLAYRSAVELADLVRTRTVSPVELVEGSLERISRIDPALNSIVTLDAEGALVAARTAASRAGEEDAPPFLGVPIAIKDLHLTAGLRSTFGTSSLAELIPAIDDENVARLRRAGFVFIGKTNVPEFGTVAYTESDLLGPCRNPWSTDHTPGGSSGGAAAAVAAGLVPVAHGSDGGGSIRIPASNCGLVGLKPTRGRITNAPLFGDQLFGLSTTGALTRHVEDTAAMLDVMGGYSPGDPHWAPPPDRPFQAEVSTDPGALRVGLATTSPFAELTAEMRHATEEAGDLLTDLGHRVEPVALPVRDDLRDHFELVWASGVSALPIDPATLEPFNAALSTRGREASAAQLLQAVTALQQASRGVVQVALAYDVVVFPTLSRAPLRIGELSPLQDDADKMFDALAEYVSLTPLANITGQPAISLPLATSGEGLPLGITFLGRPADEVTLLRVAGQLEDALDWPSRRPSV